ncbi:MAG: hypothetical protein ABJK11_03800 [Balneola sp.]
MKDRLINNFTKFIFASLMLLTLVQCRSFFEGIGNGLAISIKMPFLVISGEISTITAASIAHKDSTGLWPRDRKELNSFYKKEGEIFPKDTLFLHLEFNDANFEILEFNEINDTLAISFNTIPISNSAYLPIFFPELKPSSALNFYKYVGLAKLYSDSTNESGYRTHFEIDSIRVYDSNMREYVKTLN